MKNRALLAAALFAFCGVTNAQVVKKSFRADQKLPIVGGGSLVIDNPVGNIDVVGGDGAEIEATAVTTVTATSAALIEEGHRRTATLVGGDPRGRVLRALLPVTHNGWDASVDWTLKVPRSTNVTVLSQTSHRINIINVAGNVLVKNFVGTVVVYNVTGETRVESVNGSIVYSTSQVAANAVLTSVNGSVTANVPPDADLQWVADTAKGDIRTNLPARGDFTGNLYRGTINGPGGPSITTATLMGNIYLLANGSGLTGTQSLRRMKPNNSALAAEVFQGFFHPKIDLGDITAQQIVGDADVYTDAGRVELGKVSGSVKVYSGGGPLRFGDIGGTLTASTLAGDVTIDRARGGGTITTRGGTIRVFYTNGAMRLLSGGGDINVRRTTAPIRAQTSSGDIIITLDKGSATETITAKTEKGNILLHVNVNFSAEVLATIVTSDPDADTILSDFPGLTITREQIDGGRTRVHASGNINGGGERLVLEAADGDIRITTAPPPPLPHK